jgi:hypothetical protein
MTTLKELHEQMWKESKHADEQVNTFIVIPTLDALEYVDKAFELGKSQAIAECIKEIDETIRTVQHELDIVIILKELKAKLQAQMEKQ